MKIGYIIKSVETNKVYSKRINERRDSGFIEAFNVGGYDCIFSTKDQAIQEIERDIDGILKNEILEIVEIIY